MVTRFSREKNIAEILLDEAHPVQSIRPLHLGVAPCSRFCVPVGSKVTVLSSGSVWTRVLYQGKDGWVMSKFLK